MLTLIPDEHTGVPLLSIEKALDGVDLPGDTRPYVAHLHRENTKTPGAHLTIHEFRPHNDALGSTIKNGDVMSLIRRENRSDADVMAVLSLLKHSPHLVVEGLEIPVVGVWSNTDRRNVLITRRKDGQIKLEATPTGGRQTDQLWDVHTHLRFMAQ